MKAQDVHYRIGIDENGLGPRLGPMLVTGVLARVRSEALPLVDTPARGGLAERLGDSKALVAHGNVALGEAWARALAERGCARPGHAWDSPDALIHALALEDRGALRALCPVSVEAQCWGHPAAAFEAPANLVSTVSKDLDGLQNRGLEIIAVRAFIACSRRLNQAADRGQSRFVVDLHAMETLVLAFRELAGQDVHAVCGKVGGFKRYEPLFGPLSGRLTTTLEETAARSAYRVAGLGELSFLRDADASDRCVALASLVGKYLREALMGQIVAHYRSDDPSLPDASGYHDPVTGRFIEMTQLLRHSRAVPLDCFERRSVESPRRPAKR